MSEVTVIIPVYNMEAYISDALYSLECQSFKKFDVIIIDDGSKDNSKKIIDDYLESSLLKVKYVYQENSGVSAARNKGLDLCKTRLVCFLDADDTLPVNALELFIQYEKNYDVVAGYTGRPLSLQDNTFMTHEGLEYLLRDYLFRNTKYQFCSFLYRRDIIEKYTIRFSQDLKYGEDEEFAWKYLSHCESAITLDTYVYYYRDNQTSASHSLTFLRTQVIDTMIRVCEYYKNNEFYFYKQIETFGIPKSKLSILKQFAMNGKYELYRELNMSDKYKYSFLSLIRFPDVRIKIASIIYLISPVLFYKLMNSNKTH